MSADRADQAGDDPATMPSNCDCRRWAMQFARLAEEAVKEKQTHLSYLEALLEAEVEEREHRATARRIQEARFPAVKTLEDFDFQACHTFP